MMPSLVGVSLPQELVFQPFFNLEIGLPGSGCLVVEMFLFLP